MIGGNNMSLFGRNPNEEFYNGGKKHWMEHIDCLRKIIHL